MDFTANNMNFDEELQAKSPIGKRTTIFQRARNVVAHKTIRIATEQPDSMYTEASDNFFRHDQELQDLHRNVQSLVSDATRFASSLTRVMASLVTLGEDSTIVGDNEMSRREHAKVCMKIATLVEQSFVQPLETQVLNTLDIACCKNRETKEKMKDRLKIKREYDVSLFFFHRKICIKQISNLLKRSLFQFSLISKNHFLISHFTALCRKM